jgi:transcription initiation factor IIE alpha subunit
MNILFTCPRCGKKSEIELTGANRRIKELEEELRKYKNINKDGSDLFHNLFGGKH